MYRCKPQDVRFPEANPEKEIPCLRQHRPCFPSEPQTFEKRGSLVEWQLANCSCSSSLTHLYNKKRFNATAKWGQNVRLLVCFCFFCLLCLLVSAFAGTCVCRLVLVCMCACAHVRICVCARACVCVCGCVCVCVCVLCLCLCLYIHVLVLVPVVACAFEKVFSCL